jgi:hypothetical protein
MTYAFAQPACKPFIAMPIPTQAKAYVALNSVGDDGGAIIERMRVKIGGEMQVLGVMRVDEYALIVTREKDRVVVDRVGLFAKLEAY